MKIFNKKVISLILALVCLTLSGCELIAGNVKYEVIPTEDTYTPDYKPMSGADIDDDITVDGQFDEDFYSETQWITLNKIDGNQTATVNMTVRIAKHGLLIAADVEENTLITYNKTRPTSYDSGLELYIGFGDGETWRDGLFEVDITAGERFNIRKYSSGSYVDVALAYDNAPYYSVSRRGSINDSECTGYSVELFIPYELFGREGRCNEVYVNTTHIAMPDWETTEVRNWYNFGGRQSSLYDWSSLNQGYTFDRNGAVINQLRIKQTAGGIVSEEFGYDYTITGDTVNITIQPDAGYKLSSLKVNGVESIDNVLNGVYYSFVSTGDCDIVPTFEKIEESKIKVSDVYAWIDYPASEFNIILNNGQSDYTLEYDSTKLLIDKEKGTVKALAEGKFEVKVISGSDTASFFVTCTKVDKNGGRWDSSGYEDKINNRSDKYKTDGINGDTTVLIGDSFFDNDEGNWSDFYTNYADIYHALELGIGGSTTFDWENFISAGKLDGWSPKNLVVNLGTNNIGGDNCSYEETAEALQRLFTVLHDKMPETNIYYFSIAQRYDTTSHSLKISSCNDIMQEWCEGKDWITFLDVEDQISGADLKDGLHPKDITYKNVYLKALEDAGVFVKH